MLQLGGTLWCRPATAPVRALHSRSSSSSSSALLGCGRRRLQQSRRQQLARAQASRWPSIVALSEADRAALIAMAFAGGAASVCSWLISTRVSTTINSRNLRTAASIRLQEAQLELLNGDMSAEEAEALKLKIGKLKLLLLSMETDAEEGRAIQGRNQAPEITPLTYVRKSFTSTLKDARRHREGTETDQRLPTAVMVALSILLLLQLLSYI